MSTQNTQLVTHLGPAESYTLFGKNGVMEQNQRVHLAKGTFLYAYGYAMSEQHFVIYDDDMNAVEICDGDPAAICTGDLERYFSPFHKVSETTKPITEVFGIGFYYDETQIVSDEVIAKSLKRAHALTKLAQQEKERKANEMEETKKHLAAEYAYLERNEKDDHNIVGKNIRTELKRNFPGVKFSVRYDSFSGGDEFLISWNDGPTREQVDAIVNKYQDHHSDHTGDYWDYDPSVFNNLFGGVSYINTNREITEKAVEALRQKYPDLTEDNKTYYHFEEEGVNRYANDRPERSVESILRYAALGVDFTPPRKEEKPSESKPSTPADSAEGFQVIDYSERAIAVIGDTKPIKDELKRLGGKFNSHLTCGCGWVFRKKKTENLKEVDKILKGAIASQFPELLKGGE